MKTAVIGSGVYGKAIAKILLNSSATVSMWTEKEDTSSIIVPKEVGVYHTFEICADSEIIFLVTGTQFIESIVEKMLPYVKENTILVLGSKGILKDGTLPLDVIKNKFPRNPLAVLSGPTFAIDILEQEPVGFTLATTKLETFNKIKSVLSSAYLEYSEDLIATQMLGSLKNAYAIGGGIISGLNLGKSTECLYITRVLQEIEDTLKHFCKCESILTLAGVGDLVLTTSSPNSRNYTFGSIIALGSKIDKEEYLKNNTVEGYENLTVYYDLLNKKEIEAPLLYGIYDIVSSKTEASELFKLLLK